MAYGSSSRNNKKTRLAVLHTGEGIRRAVDMAAFLNDNPNASAHATTDHQQLIRMVPRELAAWTLGSGNPISVNVEMCAFAGMTREQWLSEETITFYNTTLNPPRNVTVDRPRQLIRMTAQWAREECEALSIPKRWLSVAEVRDGQAGICDHRTYNRAFNAGDHWDVGDGFPRDVFIADVLQTSSEDDVSFNDKVTNHAGVTFTAGQWLTWANSYAGSAAADAAAVRKQQAIDSAKIDATLRAVSDGAFDEDRLNTTVDKATREATSAAIGTAVLPALHELLGELLNDDNTELSAETARLVLDGMAARLTAKAAQQ